jgi:hypothetical protein
MHRYIYAHKFIEGMCLWLEILMNNLVTHQFFSLSLSFFFTDAAQWDCIDLYTQIIRWALHPIFELMTDSLQVWMHINNGDVFLFLTHPALVNTFKNKDEKKMKKKWDDGCVCVYTNLYTTTKWLPFRKSKCMRIWVSPWMSVCMFRSYEDKTRITMLWMIMMMM